MSEQQSLPLSVRPIINYPQEAQSGKTYLLEIDLEANGTFEEWKYEEEEYPIYCQVDSRGKDLVSSLFRVRCQGTPAVVLHRFGGTYGAAKFYLTAVDKDVEGEIRITLSSGWGALLKTIRLDNIQVRTERDDSGLEVVEQISLEGLSNQAGSTQKFRIGNQEVILETKPIEIAEFVEEELTKEQAINQYSLDTINEITGNEGQAIAQTMGGIAVGQLTVYSSQNPTEEKPHAKTPDDIGENPYQGLKAFRETDGDRFFGRDREIQALWQQFQNLHGDRSIIRVLPIYGPSGSGKSSLARAGLIPALVREPLPGQEKGRVLILTPGNHPLEALATVLARIGTGDYIPIAKTQEFEAALLEPNSKQEFDGLRRIANALPDINFSPLIVLVDQFEELYTLCGDESVRHAFVENLLCAASDSRQRVSVIIIMRSDFLGVTQQHPRLNALFSSQGFLVPIMQPEELALAITEPAKRYGYELDQAIVDLLIQGSQGQGGALPFLQFALTQIWEGLRHGVQPIETFKKIGGVGGALANEAQRIYYALTPEQQVIAHSIFLALIQLNDDNKSTRRCAAISELISSQHNETLVREVIDRFARPGVGILVTFSNSQQIAMVEIAHEALIHNWQQLKDWIEKYREALSKKRKIEQFANEWKNNNKSKAYLLQGRMLRDAREFLLAQKAHPKTAMLSNLAQEYIQASSRLWRIW